MAVLKFKILYIGMMSVYMRKGTLLMKEFEKKLLDIGGSAVLLPEEIPEQLYRFGHLYECPVRVPVGGTSRYFLSRENEVRIIWGFVLDSAGVWKMHSWLFIQENDLILDNEVYEKYFGFIKE